MTSNWADLVDENHENDPANTPQANVMRLAVEPVADTLGAGRGATLVHDEVYRLGGDEPPDHVLRLTARDAPHLVPSDWHLARVPRGENGQNQGWQWVRADAAPWCGVVDYSAIRWPSGLDQFSGWAWGCGAESWAVGVDLTPVYPVISWVRQGLEKSLVWALPWDGQWYQIGISSEGTPIWGAIMQRVGWYVWIGEDKPSHPIPPGSPS